ncbi:hypothetical protein [Aliikangiella coralliicola]|uniref:Uncharacterized protein n=1 Tax=Aliikangiella coralliicola TaxID=2592383 RepID=A0A545U5W1_9GAMM|nr:hypothetical protein [Aliikangiella coralliicola]TQV84860.1 hypothetical protein FLL46_20895 [Aliikangiella coralliicola]
MLDIDYFDGFTEELISFKAAIDGEKCNITFDCFIGRIRGDSFTIELADRPLDILSVMEALLELDERYELEIDDIGSVRLCFNWDGKDIHRYFDGCNLSQYSKEIKHKAQLENLENYLFAIRKNIVERSKKKAKL